MLSGVRDKNKGMHWGGGGGEEGICDHALSRRLLGVKGTLRVELDSTCNDYTKKENPGQLFRTSECISTTSS